MRVRDAVEADADALAGFTEAPEDVMRNLIHDRTVRVAVDGDDAIAGFVSFDAKREVVHVTQLEGESDVCERLLKEPVRFARAESMAVELLVLESDEETRAAAEAVSFVLDGPGPRFDGTPTVRYRRAP